MGQLVKPGWLAGESPAPSIQVAPGTIRLPFKSELIKPVINPLQATVPIEAIPRAGYVWEIVNIYLPMVVVAEGTSETEAPKVDINLKFLIAGQDAFILRLRPEFIQLAGSKKIYWANLLFSQSPPIPFTISANQQMMYNVSYLEADNKLKAISISTGVVARSNAAGTVVNQEVQEGIINYTFT